MLKKIGNALKNIICTALGPFQLRLGLVRLGIEEVKQRYQGLATIKMSEKSIRVIKIVYCYHFYNSFKFYCLSFESHVICNTQVGVSNPR